MKSEAVSMPTNCWDAESHSGAAGIPCKIHPQADEQTTNNLRNPNTRLRTQICMSTSGPDKSVSFSRQL